MLYACNELIRPDLVLELSWRHGLMDFSMPYMINLLCQQTKELATLKADNEARKAKEKEQEKTEDNTPILGASRLMITAGPTGMGSSPSPAPYGQANGFAPQPTGYGY
jgi:clathrin heavy chain